MLVRKKETTSSKNVSNLLPKILLKIENKYKRKPRSVIEAWSEVIDKRIAVMTKVVSCNDGVLTVMVKNSTLYSLLNNYEKNEILRKLQARFSEEIIHKLVFKIG